jgi:protein TonB
MTANEFIDTGRDRLRWFLAALLIVTMHAVGGTYGLARWTEPDSEEPSGAVLMELASIAVAPPEREDLTLGPQSELAVPTPLPSQEAAQEKMEVPQLEESPLAPEPEVVLPKAQPVETAEEVEEVSELIRSEDQVTEVNTSSSAPMALRAFEAAPDKTVKAQTVGANPKSSQSEITWQKSLIFHLKRHKRYPVEARNRRIQGVAEVEFHLDGGGHLIEARVIKGSGSALLDDEALEILKRASPFPAPPDSPTGGSVRLALPIEFKIR